MPHADPRNVREKSRGGRPACARRSSPWLHPWSASLRPERALRFTTRRALGTRSDAGRSTRGPIGLRGSMLSTPHIALTLPAGPRNARAIRAAVMARDDSLPAETPGYQTSRARAASLIAAAGIATFLGFVVAARNVFLFDLGAVAPLLGGLVLLNLALALTAARWAAWRRTIFAYQALQIALFTVVLHRLGGLVMGILFITYAFPVILSEMFDSAGSVFAVANLCAVCFAAMAWVENRSLAELGVETQQQRAFVVFAFLVLNFLALYTDRYGYQLRNLTRHLRRRVAERTAELSAANERLAAQARALEEKQDELRSFVYTVTHDLKGPLSAILLTADLLLQRAGRSLGAEGQEDLDRIVRLAGDTEDMIRDLLEMFRITSLPESPGWVELDAVVGHA